MSELKACSFESPLLVTDDELLALPAEAWQCGEKWLEALKERTGVLGIVLPLEIKAFGHQSRQDLLGVELLNWLRWSAEEPFRFLPVLAVAWQPLDAILRRTYNLLLVTRGTTFVRLPEAMETLPCFIKGVRENSSAWTHVRIEDLERIAGGNQSEQISYHDLANDFYAAHRLWEGYKHALSEANIQTEWQRAQEVSLSFTENLRFKLARPAVREYLSLRSRQASPIYYPATENWQELLRTHAKQGLPSNTRILMVDDEFDKGLAEVLLQILFKAPEFSFRLDGECVYSPDGWARLVCVKSIREAACWLRWWGEEKTFAELGFDEELGRQWIDHWVAALGLNADWMEGDQFEDIGNNILSRGVDNRPARIKPTTVLLLDLHLEKDEATAIYDPHEMASVRLWKAIKDEHKDLPIIVFTASRQAMNYSAIMEQAGQSDGWLTKEGPDITLDNQHSSWAALYLLERIHMFSCLKDWYRDEFDWQIPWKEEYSNAYLSPVWQESQNHITSEASRIFRALQTDPNTVGSLYSTLYQNVKNHVTPAYFPLEILLIARRLAVAALLETAEWSKGLPKWNLDKFKSRLNCSSRGKKQLKYANDVLNFTTMLWFRSYTPKIIGLLLPEEYRWLKQTFPATEYPQINSYIDQAYPAESR